MAKKKSIQEKRKLLKKFGFLNQDLRKNPSPQQKAAVTRQWDKYGRYLEGGFSHRKITKPQRKKFQSAGYLVKGNNVFINREGYDRVYIGKDHITKTKGDKKQKVFLHKPENLLSEMEKKLDKGLKPGQYLSVKIGDNGAFGWRTINKEEFEQYITNKFKANMTIEEKKKYKRASKAERAKIDKAIERRTQNLISQMSVVTVNQKRKDDPKRASRRGKKK